MLTSDVAIKVENLSKCYQIYDSPRDRLKQFMLPRLQRAVGKETKKYCREFWALKDVNFEIVKGETVGIIGRNGSGKSTLLQIICGTLSPTSGRIQTEGRIAALLELGSGFNPEFTGRENVYMNASVLGLSQDETDSKFDDIAAFADIGDFIEQPVKTYSSGMMMRLAFSVSVSIDPKILVVDEALSVGDMNFQQKCFTRIADLRERGTTILFVSHDIMLLRNYCSKAIYLEKGNVKCIADAETIGEAYIFDMHAERQDSMGGKGVLEWREDSSKSKLSFGLAFGRVTGVRIQNKRGKGGSFWQGEVVTVEMCGEISLDVTNPEFVFQLRDVRGYILYGIPSSPDVLQIIEETDHKRVVARLEMRLALGAGNYAVTIGLNNRQGATVFTLIDKVVSIVEFDVVHDASTRFHGCIDLQGIWKKDAVAAAQRARGVNYGNYDIGYEGLQSALSRNDEPQLLADLAELSRSLFGWFNKRQTRSDEYVWIAKACAGRSSMFIADIGAGVSPLPVYLANAGHRLLTIDYSEIQRVLGQEMETWNGWGFLDYAQIHNRISSLNTPATDLPQDLSPFDLCYSVSVIEHMTADMRRCLLAVLHDRLVPGGDLMLTIDLVPGTDELWNLDRGSGVDRPGEHGVLADILRELRKSEFILIEMKIQRDYLDEPRSDVGFIHCRRGEL